VGCERAAAMRTDSRTFISDEGKKRSLLKEKNLLELPSKDKKRTIKT